MRSGTAAILLFVLVAMSGSSTAEEQGSFRKARIAFKGGTYYLQYNMFYDEDETDYMNYHESDFLPLGTKVQVKKVKDDTLVLIPDYEYFEGKLAVDMGHVEPSYFTVVSRMLGNEPPSIEGLSARDLAGVESAEIRLGMSRRAVFLAVGYPPHDHTKPFLPHHRASNKDLNADKLTYATGSWDFLIVRFEDDVVVDIED